MTLHIIPEYLKTVNASIPSDSWVKYLAPLIVCSYFANSLLPNPRHECAWVVWQLMQLFIQKV
jgi:hypothetical protein